MKPTSRNEYITDIEQVSALSAAELLRCADIVSNGGAVPRRSATTELPFSPVLAIVRSGKDIVGVGTIKRLRPEYAASIAEKSKFEFDSHILELGYVAVSKEHRNNKLSRKITEKLCGNMPGHYSPRRMNQE
jgi:hypothetical protein